MNDDTPDVLGGDRFEGWQARPSASAVLWLVGIGALAGAAAGFLIAPWVAGWFA